MDILRFLLATEILMFHSNMHVGCSYGRIIDYALKAGAVTMTTFFMLSGFVNQYAFGGKRLQEKGVRSRFYLSRLFSIMPSYYLTAILVTAFIARMSIKEWLILLPVETLGIQSIFTSLFSISHNGGTWFISCILICYFVFPFLNQLISQMKPNEKVMWIIGLTLLLFYLPIVSMRFQTATMYTNPFARCAEYAIGMLMASKQQNGEKWLEVPKRYYAIAVLSWGGFSVWLLLHIRMYGISTDYMIYSIFFLPIWQILIVIMSRMSISGERLKKIITFCSAISYDMFLVQFFVWPIQRSIDARITFSNAQRILCVFVLCLGMAAMMHILFEKPVQKRLRGLIKNAS